MNDDLFVLTSLMVVGGNKLQGVDSLPPKIGNCSISVFSAPAGSGQTTLFEQFGTLHCRPVVNVSADPNIRTLRNEIYSAIFRDQSCYWGSDQTRKIIIDELRIQGSPVLIFDNGDRLANPKLLDVIRDIGDSSGSPIVLSCNRGRRGLWEMLHAPQTSLMEALSSRVDQFVELPALSLADAGTIVGELGKIPFEPKVVAHLYKTSGSSVRSLLRALRNAESLAATFGLERLDAVEWSRITGETIETDRSLAPPRKALEHPARTLQSVVKGTLRTSIKVA